MFCIDPSINPLFWCLVHYHNVSLSIIRYLIIFIFQIFRLIGKSDRLVLSLLSSGVIFDNFMEHVDFIRSISHVLWDPSVRLPCDKTFRQFRNGLFFNNWCFLRWRGDFRQRVTMVKKLSLFLLRWLNARMSSPWRRFGCLILLQVLVISLSIQCID